MTIAWRTGNERDSACATCAAVVRHTEDELSDGRRFWFPVRHNAPCGLPCAGGGYKPREPHHGGSRPSCSCVAPEVKP